MTREEAAAFIDRVNEERASGRMLRRVVIRTRNLELSLSILRCVAIRTLACCGYIRILAISAWHATLMLSSWHVWQHGACDYIRMRMRAHACIYVLGAAGEYVLGWRWDCEMSSQVWSSCADITIV